MNKDRRHVIFYGTCLRKRQANKGIPAMRTHICYTMESKQHIASRLFIPKALFHPKILLPPDLSNERHKQLSTHRKSGRHLTLDHCCIALLSLSLLSKEIPRDLHYRASFLCTHLNKGIIFPAILSLHLPASKQYFKTPGRKCYRHVVQFLFSH